MTKYTLPFRVGRKQGKVIVDANGLEVVKFPTEELAQEYCDFKNAWTKVSDKLPEPLQTVWITNGKGWTTLGCRTEPDEYGLWCWASINGLIYEDGGEIVAESEADDLDVQYWHPLPKPIKQ